MLKSGLIAAAVSFVLVIVAAMVAPVFAVCVGLLLGVGAGFLAGVFDKPGSASDGAKAGAGAGAIAAAGAIIGQMLAAVGLAVFFPEGSQFAADIAAELLGGPTSTLTQAEVWAQQLGAGCCISLLNIGLMTGLGAGGGAMWFLISGRNRAGASPPGVA